MFYSIGKFQISTTAIKVEMLSIFTGKCFTLYCFSTKISVSLNEKGLKFSCHIITGINVKDLSLEHVFPHII